MKKILIYLIGFLMFQVVSAEIAEPLDIYVSPKGNDSGTGNKKDPFATINKACNYIRQKRLAGNCSHATIYLRKGVYNMKETLKLLPEDSNLTIKAYKKDNPIISGGVLIKNWKLFSDNSAQINKVAKGQIWVADIPKGWKFHYLYVNGELAERSNSDNRFWRKWNRDHKYCESTAYGTIIKLEENKELLKNLPTNGDVEMLCIFRQYGVMGNFVLTKADPSSGYCTVSSKQLSFGLYSNRSASERVYRFENALCLIDHPGEWAVDSQNGKVYYWPLENVNMSSAEFIAPKLYELIRIQGDEEGKGEVARNISIEGITLAYTDCVSEDKWPDTWITRQWEQPDAMIYLSGAEKCKIKDCRLLYSGSYGVTLNHYAQFNEIEKCEIGWTGSGGVFLEGFGPGTLNVNKLNKVTRNYIHDHGLGNYWHSPCIQIYQSGDNRIAYNLLQHSAYSAISMTGASDNVMNEPKDFFNDYMDGEYLRWKQHRIRFQDFPEEVQKGIRNGSYKFNRETIKPYLHSRNNWIEYNIISEPHQKLFEGGAVYAWSIGKWNKWLNNIAFKSTGMPSSSIYALDDLAEYTTVKGNIYWINGVILDGVGARETERGNDISGNIRVNYKPEFKCKRREDKEGLWFVRKTGRKDLDNLIQEITTRVRILGGWPEYSSIGIPDSDKGLPKAGEQQILPKDAHVTIE